MRPTALFSARARGSLSCGHLGLVLGLTLYGLAAPTPGSAFAGDEQQPPFVIPLPPLEEPQPGYFSSEVERELAHAPLWFREVSGPWLVLSAVSVLSHVSFIGSAFAHCGVFSGETDSPAGCHAAGALALTGLVAGSGSLVLGTGHLFGQRPLRASNLHERYHDGPSARMGVPHPPAASVTMGCDVGGATNRRSALLVTGGLMASSALLAGLGLASTEYGGGVWLNNALQAGALTLGTSSAVFYWRDTRQRHRRAISTGCL